MSTTHSLLVRSIVAAGTALTLGLPVLVHAQPPGGPAVPNASVSLAANDQKRPAALTREQVRLEVERAMRDGTWRCRTSNSGRCSNERETTVNAAAGQRR
jgi:hypothetical protein